MNKRIVVFLCLFPIIISLVIIMPIIKKCNYNMKNQALFHQLESNFNIQKINLKTLENTQLDLENKLASEKKALEDKEELEIEITKKKKELDGITTLISEYDSKITSKRNQINQIKNYLK